MKNNWILCDRDIDKELEYSKIFSIDNTLSSILVSKKFESIKETEEYLNPSLFKSNSPFAFSQMDKAVERIKKAIAKNQKIGIFADSDLDGLTSLTILKILFDKMNLNIFYRYLKEDERYGLTIEIVNEFQENNVDLLITVDIGTRDTEEILYCKKLGIDVIVTDHHEQSETLPEAIIINPKIINSNYPNKNIAGVGVAFKLATALLFSYLPSYNKYFIIIMEENNFLNISIINNGIIKKTLLNKQLKDIEEILSTTTDIEEILSTTTDISKILVFNSSEVINFLSNSKKNYDISDFLSFTGINDQNKTAIYSGDIEKLYQIFNINSIIHPETIEALNLIFLKIQFESSPKINEFIESVLGFVAIGTIADVMPLINENRNLVKNGINSLNGNRYFNLNSIITENKITAKTIGWKIGPLLNSPGRFGKTKITADFLLNECPDELDQTIKNLIKINSERKEIVENLTNKFIEKLDGNNKNESIIFIKSELIPEGLTGLIANKLSGYYNKPAIAVSLPGSDNLVKGSGRSTNDYNFFNHVEKISKKFDRIGGHKQAFGFTINIENIEGVINTLNESIQKDAEFIKVFNISTEIEIDEITNNFIEKLTIFEPIGKNNEDIIFLSRKINIKNFIKFGNPKIHGRYYFSSNNKLTGIGWNNADKMKKFYEENKNIDIIYTLEINEFRNIKSPQMIIIDIDYS